jgi:hypothetical protein
MANKRIGAALVYWIPTGLLALDAVFGGVSGVLRQAPVLEAFRHLGYPEYFAVLLGVAKVAGGLAIVVPVPRVLREWAYAGLAFDVAAAVVSVAAVGDPASHVAVPAVFLGITLFSAVMWHRRVARSVRAAPVERAERVAEALAA